MEEFIKLAAQRHRSFEIGIGAKEHHKLELQLIVAGSALSDKYGSVINYILIAVCLKFHTKD